MGSTMLLLLLIGAVASNPMTEMRERLADLVQRSTNLDEPNYRLQDTVQPLYVNVDLDVYLPESKFNGLVQLEVNIQVSDLTQIVLHQKVVKINAVSVVNSANQAVALQVFNPFEIDSYYELLKINLANAIPAGNYLITISYEGKINENPVDRGFYKGYYYDGSTRREYATTQFQPFHARKAFPCFDEPQFKSRFVLSITRDAALQPSFSNMAINDTQTVAPGRVRETFLPTPTISAYLIAFHVSDFVATELSGNPDKRFSIISRPNAVNQHGYAADIGFVINEELSTYFAIDFYEMGQGQPMKNDHIALPDFPSGAMENWGMVNYREAYLLLDENHTNLPNRIFIASIIAHELGHKWFGNLVTCFWWSNLWLNESFASFLEYFGAHWADPSLELADQFVVDHVHSALNWDAGAGATPMNWTGVVNNPSVSSHFSTTSYAKGASVLRMMEHFVGPFNFRTALRYYLKENSYKIGYPSDMYAAFRRAASEDRNFATRYPGIDVGNVLDSWIQNPGSPVLNVNVNTNTGAVTVQQERFLISGSLASSPIWQVPVSWTSGANPNFDDLRPALVMTGSTGTFTVPSGNHWLILNVAQSGLYRVNYDDDNWARIAEALRTDRHAIHKLSRAQIVNDVLHFLRADKISIDRAFDVLDFLAQETDYYVWSGAMGQLDWLRRRLEHLPAAQEQFNTYMLNLMTAAIDSVGYEDREGDSTSVIMQRMQLLNYACFYLNHEGCIEYSKNRWTQYRNNPNDLVPVNARRYVYCIGLREGDASDYNFLFNVYNNSQNTADMVVILRTLACTRNEASINNYLEQSMFNDKIRIHDKTNAFQYALLAHPENLPHVLQFVYTRFQEIITWYGGEDRFAIALGSLSTYLTKFEDITAFQTWLYNNQVALPESFSTGQSVINTAISNLEWGNRLAPNVFSNVKQRNSAVAATTPFALLILAVVAHLFR